MSSNQIKSGVILSYVQMAANMIIGLTYTPLMIRLLGQSEYGLYSTTASVISMLSVLSLGFGSGYVKYYAKYKVSGDKKAIEHLNGLFLLVFTIIGIISFACGMALTNHLELVFQSGLTETEYVLARKLMVLLTINLSLSFPMSVFSTIINANERFIFLRSVNLIKTILSPVVTVVALYAGYRSVAMVSITVVLALIADLWFIYYVIFVLKNRFCFGQVEPGLFKSMFVYTTFIMINTMAKQVNWNIPKIILGRYQGTSQVAIYSVAASLHVYYENFATAISHIFRPRVHLIVNGTKGDLQLQRKVLTDLMVKVGRIQYIVLGLIATGLIFFGRQFITAFWVGDAYDSSYAILLLLILPATFTLIQALGMEIQRALDLHKFRSIVYIGMAIINVMLTVVLSQDYGAIGAAVGTAVSLMIVDVVVINIYYQKRCNIDIFRFWKEICTISQAMLIPVAAGTGLVLLINTETTAGFIGGIAAYSMVYFFSMWFLVLNEDEKTFFAKMVRRFIPASH